MKTHFMLGRVNVDVHLMRIDLQIEHVSGLACAEGKRSRPALAAGNPSGGGGKSFCAACSARQRESIFSLHAANTARSGAGLAKQRERVSSA